MDESNASSLSWAPLGESPVLTPQVGLFTGTLASGNHTGAWLTDHGHVRGVCHAPGRDRLDTAPGLGRRRMDEHMIEGPVTPQPIAAVLADVDGTLVTSAKVVTKRAI